MGDYEPAPESRVARWSPEGRRLTKPKKPKAPIKPPQPKKPNKRGV